MKDYVGTELAVGDTVIAVELDYRNFIDAKIVRMTKSFVILQYRKHGVTREFKQSPLFVISRAPLVER